MSTTRGTSCASWFWLLKGSSQCLGASEQSVVALALTRPNVGNRVAFPAAQLRITAALVARVVSRGG